MKLPQLVVNGKPIPLGKRIGRGGEGDVYTIADGSNRAVKFYTVSDPTTRQGKVNAMVANRLSSKSSLVAFPLAVAHSHDGKFAGFVMNLVVGHKPLFEIYSPGARKKSFPRADYRFLVRTAANIARAVGSVHSANCVIGDINHSGILISHKATAALIDADSFQFSDSGQQFYCKVGVPEYTPPELQGKKLSSTLRTKDHDAFGLAIVIFQMLCMGRHPFVGTYSQGEMPIERAIREYRFAYSNRRAVGMVPPPGAVLLSDFPDTIAEAFESAFSQNTTRPSAEKWVSLLTELEQCLRKCDTNPLHHYPSAASECIWCRMENKLGITLFLPDFSHVKFDSSHHRESFNLNALWTAIETINVVANTSPVLPNFDLEPSAETIAYKNAQQNAKVFGIIVSVVALGLLVYAPNFTLIWIAMAIAGVYKIFAGSGQTLNLESKLDSYNDSWNQAISNWQTKCGLIELHALKKKLINAKHSYEQLAQERAHKLSVYQLTRREDQLQQYLENFPIRSAKVKGIGPARHAALASFGIDTAAECTWENLLRVPGFGPKNSVPLNTWREKLKSKFIYSDQLTDADNYQIQLIDSDIETRAAALKTFLISGPANLSMLSKKVRTLSAMVDPEIIKLYKSRCQLEVDLKFLGKDVGPLQLTANTSQHVHAQARAQVFPSVSERDVFNFFGTTYHRDGDTYQRNRQVVSCRLDNQTMSVTGIVKGVEPRPYQVSVELDDTRSSKIKLARCACRTGGSCEHSAALLLEAIRSGILI